RDLAAFVERRAGADAAHKVDVLLIVGIDHLAFEFPRLLTPNPARRHRGALGADEAFAHARRGALDLTAKALHARAVGVFILDREVVPGVAVFRIRAALASAHAERFHGRATEGPVHDIEVVHVLLDDVV